MFIWIIIYGNDYFLFFECVVEGGKKYFIYGWLFIVIGGKLIVDFVKIFLYYGIYDLYR